MKQLKQLSFNLILKLIGKQNQIPIGADSDSLYKKKSKVRNSSRNMNNEPIVSGYTLINSKSDSKIVFYVEMKLGKS